MSSTEGDGVRVLVWGENRHERSDDTVANRYPEGMHGAVAAGIREHLPGARVATATLEQPEHGLTEEVLERTDVLTWWGHMAHGEVEDAVVERVHRHVLAGMGLLVLHSGHWSKIFTTLMGTTCTLRWRESGDRELLWTVNPQHPITRGVPHPIVLDEHEMYGEYFDVPTPDELIFVSSFSGGEVFRSGMTFRRGFGKIFFFSPGDQDFPIYHHPDIRRVIANGVAWARPEKERRGPELHRHESGQLVSYTDPDGSQGTEP